MRQFTLGHQSFLFHDNIDHVVVKKQDDGLSVTWSQGVNTNVNNPWHIEARVLASRDGVVFSIQQVILQEPMSDSFCVTDDETSQFLSTIEQILRQKTA